MDILAFFRTNTVLKISAVIIAFTIWFNAMLDISIHLNEEIPLDYYNFPDSMVLTQISSEKVSVILQGKRKDFLLLKLFGKKPQIFLNIKEAKLINKKYFIKIDKSMINFPMNLNISVEKIKDPDTIYFSLDTLKAKLVSVVPSINGKPLDGYIMYSKVYVNPKKIEISGGKNLVEKTNYIETGIINVEGLSKSINKKLKLKKPNKFIQLSQNTAEVSIMIERLISKEYNDVPVTLLNKPINLRIYPESININVKIEGPENIVNNLLSGELSPFIDISNIHQKGKYQFPLSTLMPNLSDIKIISIKPEIIELEAK